MSLIYGYNSEKDEEGDVSDLEKIVGKKTDASAADTAFGRIKKNKNDISSSVLSTSNVISSVVSSLGQKTDDKSADTAFGKIQKNASDIIIKNLFADLKLNTAKSDIQTNDTLLGQKTDSKSVDSAFGRIQKNKKEIQTNTNFVGSKKSMEGDSNLKGVQLSHANAIAAHAGNLLSLEGVVGKKPDAKETDTAFGRIQRNKEDIQNLSQAVELKETAGIFIAPIVNGKVEITGWTLPRQSTIVAILIKAHIALTGVSRATLYSGSSSSNNNHTMTVPMSLPNMKLGRPAVIVHTRDPSHSKMYANTRGHAVGSLVERMISVKFIYIDHS